MTDELKFFTNEPERDLYGKFQSLLLGGTKFFDVMVGYFRTSGFFRLCEALESVEKIRILVGLNVDKRTAKLLGEPMGNLFKPTLKVATENFSEAVKDEFDDSDITANVERGVRKFLAWIESGKLELRIYTAAPLHAKVYIMRQSATELTAEVDSVITGSSNFSEAGLISNLEFNVELKDLADVEFAHEKFEELWKFGEPVSGEYVDVVQNRTWLRDDITPHEIYLKTLYEFFKEEINADREDLLENFLPENSTRLQYQTDAVIQAKKILEAYGGVFISDVVGLGKTYIRDKILRYIMIRRTRNEIAKYYANDLQKNGVTFPKLGTPQPVAYDFDAVIDKIFLETVRVIKNFHYARYMPLSYLLKPEKYSRMNTAQRNLGGFMKSILVKRLESSFFAFRNTLRRFEESYQKFIAMFERGDDRRVVAVGRRRI